MPSRRSVLAVLGLALAGCTETDPSGAGSEDSPESSTMTESATSARESVATASTPTPDLDLREANVVDVEWTGQPGGDVTFDVTLYHDDSGEEGYANWWQVETTEGEQLGRRELLHAHGTRRFTRSETVTIPSEVRCAVVRGHDQTHAYGGQAAHVDIVGETVRYVEQGADPASFADRPCPD